MRKTIIYGLIVWLCVLLSFLVMCTNKETKNEKNAQNDEIIDEDDDDPVFEEMAINGEVWVDITSGLMWERNDDCCFQWDDALEFCKDSEKGGYYDWRLPTISELRSLIRGCPKTYIDGNCGITAMCYFPEFYWNEACLGCEDSGGPGLNGEYWPKSFKGDFDIYWSSNIANDDGFHDRTAWQVNYKNASVFEEETNFGDSYHPVRCVRSGAIWRSPESGLMWQNGVSGRVNWMESKLYCEHLNWGGYSDWRLPTISELRTLVVGCPQTENGGDCKVTESCLEIECWSEECAGCVVGEVPSADDCYCPDDLANICYNWYWSLSEVEKNATEAWGISYNRAAIYNEMKSQEGRAFCVRNN